MYMDICVDICRYICIDIHIYIYIYIMLYILDIQHIHRKPRDRRKPRGRRAFPAPRPAFCQPTRNTPNLPTNIAPY